MKLSCITFRNYRAFGAAGATIPLGHEFVGLIGTNNSGKSTLLRAFLELRPIFAGIAAQRVNTGEFQGLLSPQGQPGFAHPNLPAGERAFSSLSETAEPRITFEIDPDDSPASLTEFAITYTRSRALRIDLKTVGGGNSAGGLTQIVSSVVDGRPLLAGISSAGRVEFDWTPVGESLRSVADSMYVGAFRNAINAGGGSYYDISIGGSFLTQFDDYKNGSNYQANEAVQKLSDELARILGISRLQISVSSDKTSLVYMIDDKSYRGAEQGSGLAQFVIVAANVLVKRPNLLLIDEPELNLHASLQRQFLTLLAGYVPGGVIFATHSLGLARSVADRIIVVQRDPKGQSAATDFRAIASLASTLGELGYGGLNDSAYKAVLLVEGVTEVRLFQELLTKYGVRNEVVIVPLGGDDLASGNRDLELAELTRLSDKTFAVVDSERSSAGASPAPRRLAFQESCSRQGIDCQVLDRRAIENYMDLDIARRVFRTPNALDIGPFDKPGVEWSWNKEKNWRIVEAMRVEMFESTDLGVFARRVASAVLPQAADDGH